MTSLLKKLSISIKIGVIKRYGVCLASLQIVDRIRRQSSWAICELCSHRRRRRDKTVSSRRRYVGHNFCDECLGFVLNVCVPFTLDEAVFGNGGRLDWLIKNEKMTMTNNERRVYVPGQRNRSSTVWHFQAVASPPNHDAGDRHHVTDVCDALPGQWQPGKTRAPANLRRPAHGADCHHGGWAS